MTDKNQTPDEHSSIVGGSTAARRLNCYASYKLEQQGPPDTGSIYAREGTALHEMIAQVLQENLNPEDMLPFVFKRDAKGAEEAFEFTVTEDLWFDLGQPALDAFDDFIEDIEREYDAELSYVVETRAAMAGIPNAFGTSDVVWKCGEASGVWDWKFGRTKVSAEDNAQGKFYGRAAASTRPDMFGAKSWGDIDKDREVYISIMQPQCSSEPDTWVTTVGDLERFRMDLIAAVTAAQAEGAENNATKGKWCAFARCKSICPLHINQSAVFGEKMAAIKDNAERNDVAISEVSSFGLMLPDLLDLAEVAQEWAKEVFKAAHAYAEDGNAVDGWMLTPKRSAGREWLVTDEEVKTFMKNRKFTLDEYMPRKLMTMPKLEALLKRTNRTVPEEMYQKKPSSGSSFVRSNDDREEFESHTQRAEALGTKLAALRGGEPAE